MPKPISLQGFRVSKNYENSDFQRLYEGLLRGDIEALDEEERIRLLKWAVFFFNRGDEGVRRLGYRIIVRYSNLGGDYIPLYDTSLNAGFIPVAEYVARHFLSKRDDGSGFMSNLLSAYQSFFHDGNKYLSVGQKILVNFNKSNNSDAVIVAPTSYGKSEMMISKVADNVGRKVCIIAPSKALLAQTKKRLIDNKEIVQKAKRVLTHPEMFVGRRGGDGSFVAVLTQERLSRIIKSDPDFCLDILLVDEAHNLLSGDERGALLLQVIFILKHRNPAMELKFYTPFIADAKSLQSPYSRYELASAHTREYIKTERYFVYDVSGTRALTLYDQFVDRHISIGALNLGEIEFIKAYRARKNIVYLNKPRDVEAAAVSLSQLLEGVSAESSESAVFVETYKAISEFLHPEYRLLSCMEKGVIYHHGKMPEIIRLYVESLFSNDPRFSFIVTTSTLLEGVNIPAERMFLLSPKKGRRLLSRAAFKNLTGRVCRFSEVFSEAGGGLHMLEPEIYVIGGSYFPKGSSAYSFIGKNAKVKSADKDQDDVENSLLRREHDDESKKEAGRALEYIENIERGAARLSADVDGIGPIRYVDSDIAKACFKNNVRGFDIYASERVLEDNYAGILTDGPIDEVGRLLDAISAIFITGISWHEGDENWEFHRLENAAARQFYAMILDWRINGASYNKMIYSFLSYWEKMEEKSSGDEVKVYVGNAWGEVKWFEEEHIARYVDLKKKSIPQRVNLAIVKIKEEQDFVEFNLMKYVDVLNDLGCLDGKFYDRIRYGSSDPMAICLMKNGVSLELANRLLSGSYNKFLYFDLLKDDVTIDKGAIQAMLDNGENKVIIFELEFHAT